MRIATAFALLAFAAVPAGAVRADQYDCIFKWTNVAAARADAAAQAHTALDDQGARQFLADHVIAPIQVWRASQDTTDGQGNIVHNPLPGFFALISSDSRMPALEADPALQLCVNRDKMNRGERPYLLLSTFSAAILLDLRFAPVYMGANVPFGSLQ